MDEKLNQELVEWIKKGGEFVEREAPQLAAECVAWTFWDNMIGCTASAVVAVALILLSVFCYRAWKKKEFGDHPPLIVGTIAPAILATLVLLFGVGGCGMEVIKCVVAPRVVVLEYLKGAAQ